MKRILCLVLALVLLLSLGIQAFADDVLYCRMCGKQIPSDSKVCQYCGEKVIHTDSAAAPKPADSPAAAAPAVATNTSAAAASAPAESEVFTATKASPSTAAAAPGPFNTTAVSPTASGKVRVTKSPTSESVPYGGSCLFIAHADNANSITWYIANADASLITTAAEAPSRVAGLYVSGSNSDTLSLSGIPSWMNGCQVQACFNGDGGPVYSEIARIWTYQPEQQQKCKWSVWDWYNCNSWCDPWYWDYPWYWDCPGSSISYDDHIDGSFVPPIQPSHDDEDGMIEGNDFWSSLVDLPGNIDIGADTDPLSEFSQSVDLPVMQEPPISGKS